MLLASDTLIVRRLQGLLSSNPGDALRAPSGSWPQPVLRVPSNRAPEKSDGQDLSWCPLRYLLSAGWVWQP